MSAQREQQAGVGIIPDTANGQWDNAAILKEESSPELSQNQKLTSIIPNQVKLANNLNE